MPLLPPAIPMLRSGAVLIDPNATTHEVVEYRFKNQTNVGCSWDVTLPYELDLQQFSDNDHFTLKFADPLGGPADFSPPLVLTHGSSTAGRTTKLSGVDWLTMQLTSTSATIPVFYNQDSWYIVTQIASYCGVIALFNGDCPRCTIEQFPWFEQRLDQAGANSQAGNGLTLAKYAQNSETCGNLIAKLLHDTGCEFRINNDHVEILPMGYEQTPSRDVVILRTEKTVNRTHNFAQIVLAKTGSDQMTYVFDATGGGVRTDPIQDRNGQGLLYPRATPVCVNGKIRYAKFLDQNGFVCGYNKFQADAPDVPITSENQAESVEWEAIAGGSSTFVRLRVEGLPPVNAIWIPHGSYTYGWTVVYPDTIPEAGATSPRVQRKIITSPYWQNEAIAVTIRESLLEQYNKERNGIVHYCGLDPMATFNLPGFRIPGDASTPPMRVESIEMSDGPGGRQMVLSGYVTA